MEPQQQAGGYHETLVMDQPDIICTLCFRLPKAPRQCSACKAYYCLSEINLIDFNCLVCANTSLCQLDSATFTRYLNIPMFCSICSSVMRLQQYPDHSCFLIPCWNSSICGHMNLKKHKLKNKGVCSPACLLIKMKKEQKPDKEIMLTIKDLLKQYKIQKKQL